MAGWSLDVPARTWVDMTAEDFDVISFQVGQDARVKIKASDDTAPTSADGAFTYVQASGEYSITIDKMFPGSGGTRLWAYCDEPTQVTVHYA